MSKKYDVLIQPFEYPKDRIYTTLGYNFGFSLKHYQINHEIYQINPASILFLAFYKKKFAQEKLGKIIEISVNPGNTTISFVSTSKKIIEDFKKLNQFILFNPEDEFEEKKKIFVEEYLTKENEFPNIFNLSILEFLGQNKRFSRYELFNHIQKVTQDEVNFAQKVLFEAMETKVFILGDINEKVSQLLKETVPTSKQDCNPKSIFFPLTEKDIVAKEVFVQEEGKRDLLIHSNPNHQSDHRMLSFSAEDVFLVYQILSEHYRDLHPILSIDCADMGIHIAGINRIDLSKIDDVTLSTYIDRIKKQPSYLIKERPKLYSMLFVVLWLSKIDYIGYNINVINQSLSEIRYLLSKVLDESLFCTVNSNK